MVESREKKGIFGRFFDLLSGKPPSDGLKEEFTDGNPHAPSNDDPLDLRFVKRYSASGGKFLYCQSEPEALDYLRHIRRESALDGIYNQDASLQDFLKKAQLVLTEQISQADAFCCGCEWLVAFNGGVMLTGQQTLGRKLSELPDTFIVIARTSQITENLRSALTGIRQRYGRELPSQITTLKGPKKVEEIDESDTTSVTNKEIYLLLMEDQL